MVERWVKFPSVNELVNNRFDINDLIVNSTQSIQHSMKFGNKIQNLNFILMDGVDTTISNLSDIKKN